MTVTQETAASEFVVVPMLGLGTIDQAAPSHDSMRVRLTLESSTKDPTAVHELAEMHDTPRRRLSCVPLSGLGTIDQAVPSQDSTSVWDCREVFTE